MPLSLARPGVRSEAGRTVPGGRSKIKPPNAFKMDGPLFHTHQTCLFASAKVGAIGRMGLWPPATFVRSVIGVNHMGVVMHTNMHRRLGTQPLRGIRLSCLAVLIALAVAMPTAAQTDRGTITGTVTACTICGIRSRASS